MSCQVEKRPKSLSDKKAQASIMQLLEQKGELTIILEKASLNGTSLEERRKAAEKPLYIARYE